MAGSEFRVPIDRIDIEAVRDHRLGGTDVTPIQASIEQHGLLQPIAVRVILNKGKGGNRYQLIAGRRRLAAIDRIRRNRPSVFAERFPKGEVPCKRVDCDEKGAQVLSLVENLERESVSPAEVAMAVCILADEHGMTSDEIGNEYGRTGAWARMYGQIGRSLTSESMEALHEGRITVNQAKLLSRVELDDQAEHLEALIEEREPPTRQTTQPLEAPAADGDDPPASVKRAEGKKPKKQKKVQNSKATEKLRKAAGAKPKRPGVKEIKAKIDALDAKLDLDTSEAHSDADLRDLACAVLRYAAGEVDWSDVICNLGFAE